MKLAIYTVLIGTKEELNNPLHYLGTAANSDLELDFICFTDNPNLTSPIWNIRLIKSTPIPPEKLSRQPKALPHRLLPDHEFSLYIDNTVVFKRLPCLADIGDPTGAVFKAFRHPWRSCPLDEADIVVKSGLDQADTVAAQIAFYNRYDPLENIRQLTAGTVLLRRHHHPDIIKFGELWWEQILLFSKRDQLSLDFCARAAGCVIAYFDGDKTNNDLFVWPALPSGKRIQASFDADRYAWENRDDPVARTHPREHFLKHAGADEKYIRQVPWFRYLCDRAGSSLGDSVPPRRGLADSLERLLARIEPTPANILIAGVLSEQVYAADISELKPAETALNLYFRFSAYKPNVVSTVLPEKELGETAPYRAAYGLSEFRLILIFGLSTRYYQYALAKFLPLLAKNGQLLAQFGEPLTLEQINNLNLSAPKNFTLDIFHGRHILENNIIPSSVLVLSQG